jgi:Dihaem cytochrome c
MRPIHLILVATTALLFLAGPGLAHDRGERGEHRSREERSEREPQRSRMASSPSPAEVLYRKECGACHLAYPPWLLPASSWRRTMAGLERHFGQNAEFDAETGASLESWLVGSAAEAGDRRRPHPGLDGEAPLRISETPRFMRKHRKVDAGVLARPSIRSFANCAACHSRAGEWEFDDDGAKIPAR